MYRLMGMAPHALVVILPGVIAVQIGAQPAGPVRVEPWGSNSLRVRLAPAGGEIVEPIIGALLPQPPQVRHGPAVTDAWAGGWSVTHGNLRVIFNERQGTLTAERVSDGALLLRQNHSATFGHVNVPNARAGSHNAVLEFDGLQPAEYFYGLGEQRRNEALRRTSFEISFSRDSNYSAVQGGISTIPWYCSSRGYGFLWNMPSLGHVQLSDRSIKWMSKATRNIDFWLTTTPGNLSATAPGGQSFYADLLHQYADAVGHPRKMPFWATGFIQSKDRYRDHHQVLSIAQEYKRRGLPISMIVVDWFHWKHMGDWTFNPDCFPDPSGLVEHLRAMGIELMATFWPYVGMPYLEYQSGRSPLNITPPRWEEFRQKKRWLALNATTGRPDAFWEGGPCYLCDRPNALVDATNPEAMKRVTDLWYQGYGKHGIKAVWLDQSEPDHSQRFMMRGGQFTFHEGADAELLPAWVKYWTRGFARSFDERGAGGDFFLLARQAWAGTAAAGAALWSGDIQSTWESLRAAVPIGQGVAMSGVPLWTTDIGGYKGGNTSDPSFQELVVRWFQFGAFCPLFRTHGHREVPWPGEEKCLNTNGANEVWTLVKREEHYEAIKAVMLLRESLRNYVEGLSEEAASTGMPIMRPMVLHCAGDPMCETDSIKAQFMLGPDWLIAPVTESVASSWPAYLPALPATDEWVYYWNQTAMPGPGWVTINTAAIANFPLFHRRRIRSEAEGQLRK